MIKSFALFLIALLAFTTEAESKCGGSAVQILPSSDFIHLDGKIIIQGYGGSQSLVRRIGHDKVAFLVSGEQKIKLILDHYVYGHFNWSQAILSFERKLDVGKTYTLHIPNITKKEKQKIVSSKSKWNATSLDQKSIVSYITPVKSEIKRFGCGPGAESIFSTNKKLEHPHYFLVEVRNHTSKERLIYAVVTEDNNITIGHGMCSGPLKFKVDHTYDVRFKSLHDSSAKGWSEWLPCENPWNKRSKNINK